MFVIEIGVLCPYNSKKIMQIHDNILIAECSSYDFKEKLELKKVKSWLKSVSDFASTNGSSLFYGVNDDGMIVGLENPQADADFIREMIKARLDPVSEDITYPDLTRMAYFARSESKGRNVELYYYENGESALFIQRGE